MVSAEPTPIRICIVTGIFPPEIGGPATYTYELASRWKAKHMVKIVTMTRDPVPIEGVNVSSVGFGIFEKRRIRYLCFLNLFKNLFLFLLRNTRDSHIFYVQQADYIGLVCLSVARILKKPIVLKFVGDRAWEEASARKLTSKALEEFLRSPQSGFQIRLAMIVQGFVCRHVDKIVVPSRYLGTLLARYYHANPTKIMVIPNAIDVNHYVRPVIRMQKGRPTLCTIGRLVPWKCIDDLIRVMPELVKAFPQATLVVVGEGPEKQSLQKLAEETGMQAHVIFRGILDHKGTIEAIKSADLFLLNSRYEGLPHVVIEAMACKVPVIATNIPGTNELVIHNRTGLLVEAENQQDLLQKIQYALRNPKEVERLAENAYASVEDSFVWERTLPRLESMFQELVNAAA